jgi:hypothetical protein
MNKNKFRLPVAAAGLLATLAFGSTALAQSSDAIIDKLVEKGILTTKEANELREEADKNFTTSYQVKSGMSDWVSALKFNGDLRGRFDGIYSDGPAFVDRNRFRYRFRFGATAVLKDNFEVGLRLASAERAENFGGDPISAMPSGRQSTHPNGPVPSRSARWKTRLSFRTWCLTPTTRRKAEQSKWPTHSTISTRRN